MTEKHKAPRFDRAVAELNPQERRKAAVQSEARASAILRDTDMEMYRSLLFVLVSVLFYEFLIL
jgi:hypothetical protein